MHDGCCVMGKGNEDFLRKRLMDEILLLFVKQWQSIRIDDKVIDCNKCEGLYFRWRANT
jgi:hypothetical protein